ncbi:N-acetylmuramoyl-L-alanine amidase [Solilutibacter tolerans]|nr:N-acetylmuramoyl-L-alanine amidase [Lysobacter tolerans]
MPLFNHNKSMLRLGVIALAGVLLAGCASMPAGQRSALAEWKPSPNHALRKPSIIVLHYTVEDTLDGSHDILSDPKRKHPVSSHYLLDRDGRLLQLVPDHLAAWHAGVGNWGAMRDLNQTSIGIEIVNTGSEPFPDAQIDALIALLGDLTTRHDIPRSQVIGHADLAPGRKIDPGQFFPWKKLADAGFGIWPQGELIDPPPGFDPWMALRVIGYRIDNPRAALHSFRLRFRGIDDGDRGTEKSASNIAQENAQALPALQPEDLRILYALTRQQ